ncbi:MAG TPA: sulfotransferase [Kofleriaceae bacterium]|nr:sulfotransferase [Kofleriaceae bacterium]
MTARRIKVLCITGWCRNGSTIIGNLLNEVDGFFHAGELHFLWKNAYGNGSNTRCGCGLDLVRCPIWSKVLAAELPAGSSAEHHAEAVRQRQAGSLRTRHTWRVLRGGLGSDARREHAATMARTYRAIAEATGASVIVDSTKLPGEAALLPHVAGIDPLFLHLVRDPRAVAHSWSRQKDYVHAMPPARSAAYWLGFNLASRAIVERYPERSTVMRYEDFIGDPAAAIRSLIELCGGDPSDNPVRGRIAELGANHTVTGNPDRFRTGATEIRAFDGPWQDELSSYAKLATLVLSWPLLNHYGYSLRGAMTAMTDDTGRSSDGSRPHA